MADFQGFRFGNYHSSNLHLIVVSLSNRFDKNLLPAPNDTSVDIPGANGKYYFGSVFKEKNITVKVAYDDMDEETFRHIAQIFSTDKLMDLVFDEEPYKTYKAKCKSAPDFQYVCFKNPETGQRIYKGEGTLSFICYHPLAYCFNKYVVTAADYYKCEMPENIINPNSIHTNRYEYKNPKRLNGLIKDHYNIKPNMATKWEGGYPTIEQVQWGELYYNKNGKKELLSDVHHYWDNIPKWQVGANLLTTPTLDYEQELIYMPQYSRVNYYNMETGLNKQNALIGSRMLVYNPGDVPVDFKLHIDNLKTSLRDLGTFHFRISRYNVQRLTLEQAVDWTGLKTYSRDDNETFKYGTRYVNILEQKNENGEIIPYNRVLKDSHPNHMYVTEPIERKEIFNVLRNYAYQTGKRIQSLNLSDLTNAADISSRIISYQKTLNAFIDEKEKEFESAITINEKNQIYWEVLIQTLEKFCSYFDQLMNQYGGGQIFTSNYSYNDFIYDLIYNPLEFILTSNYKNYDQVECNFVSNMNYITSDYIELDTTNLPQSLNIDFETRMVYNIIEDQTNIYQSQEKINYYNDNIVQGHWFLIPPGWSLIEITPVLKEGTFDGKRWKDARPFYWGNMSESSRNIYEKCLRFAAIKYLSENSPLSNLKRQLEDTTNPFNDTTSLPSAAKITESLEKLETYQIEELLQFRRWFETDSSYNKYVVNPNGIRKSVWGTRMYRLEINFLKLLNDYWRIYHLDSNGYPTSDASDWWWNASNYIWVNFPPVYWTYVDVLNKMNIEFIPEFY